MAYKIQRLIEEGYDFDKLFPEKQEAVKVQAGLDFTLSQIVLFLQKQTNNFTIDNPVAHDLDDAIMKVIASYEEQKQPEPKEEKQPEPKEQTEEELKQEWQDAIDSLTMLLSTVDENDPNRQEWQEAIDTLTELLKTV